LSPQQLFGWRRQLRESAARHSEAEGLQFVPAVVDAVAQAPALRRERKADGVMRLSAAQLSALLEGLDWRRVHEARETVTPTQPG
jgi:transposase-like protein